MLNPLFKYATAGLVFVAMILGLALHMERRSHAKAKVRIAELVEMREADRKAYAAAQAEAAARNKAEVARITAKQEKVTHEIASDYQRQLAALRLRSQARANRGATGSTGVSGVPQAPGGADENGVPDPSCDLLCAQEIELRLLYLQRWVSQQVGVE